MTTHPPQDARALDTAITALLRRTLDHAEAVVRNTRQALGLPPATSVGTEDLRAILGYARRYDVEDDPAVARVTDALAARKGVQAE